jgi:AraC-like DNA-binding protein
MARAEVWLTAGWPTRKVARALSFTDAPHFCREFKQWHGVAANGSRDEERKWVFMPALMGLRVPPWRRRMTEEDFF